MAAVVRNLRMHVSAINSAAVRVQIVERPTATTSARDFEPRSLRQFLSHSFFASNSKSFPPPQLAACCETGGVLCILPLYGSSGISRLRPDCVNNGDSLWKTHFCCLPWHLGLSLYCNVVRSISFPGF